MSRRIFACIALLSASLASSAARAEDLSASDAKQLFSAYGCNACHEVDEARIGPPYRAVAARYVRSAQVERDEWLARKIRLGGAGSWGFVPMVANPRLSAQDALAIARWILALEPGA
ncbi:MAG TPA: c-type cytochrome [Myxococcota bacterium]|nr:c-type cytochrome [Myxococcota bacterium]